jgi:hypothetical protein
MLRISNHNHNNSQSLALREEIKYPTKDHTIQYIYTDSQHNNPLCRVVPLKILQKEKDGKENGKTLNYDKEKYREMILDVTETVLGYFGFDKSLYGKPMKNRKKKEWYEELHEERTKDIDTERMMEKQ